MIIISTNNLAPLYSVVRRMRALSITKKKEPVLGDQEQKAETSECMSDVGTKVVLKNMSTFHYKRPTGETEQRQQVVLLHWP